MKNKTIVIIVLVIIGFAGLMWWGKLIQKPISGAPGSIAGTESVLNASEKLYDFGTISMKNGDVSKEFTVINPTNKDITVNTILTSCMCTSAFVVRSDGSVNGPFKMPGMGYVPPANETIKVGESRVIRVVYNPNAHGPTGVGQIDRFVNLTDSTGGELQLEIKALVTP